MIVDSSAIMAIILNEPDEPAIVEAMLDAQRLLMSSATWLESGIIVDRHRNPDLAGRFGALIAELAIEIVPVSADHARIARDAHARFGRGVHRARLNYGDCFSYALARQTREPLLCKGDDFIHTDIALALKV